jgi:predicted RNase H-like nuclease (RuvC/YqgF family)
MKRVVPNPTKDDLVDRHGEVTVEIAVRARRIANLQREIADFDGELEILEAELERMEDLENGRGNN